MIPTGTAAIALEGGEPGPIITIGGIEKAGQDLGTHTFQFTTNAAGSTADATGTTMGDFMNWLEATLGLTSEDGLGGGIALDPATGGLVINSNEGTAQALDLESSDFTVTNNGTGATQPFMFSDTAEATGESVRTSFVVYDSLGAPLTIDMTMVLQSTDPNGGSTWAWISETDDNDALGRIVGSGELTFDSEGRLDFVDGNAFRSSATTVPIRRWTSPLNLVVMNKGNCRPLLPPSARSLGGQPRRLGFGHFGQLVGCRRWHHSGGIHQWPDA